MQRVGRRARPKTRTKIPEPLVDTIPLNSQGHRNWKVFSDDEIVVYAKDFVQKNGVKSRKELGRRDCGLYGILRTRNLIEKIGLKRKDRNWSSLSDKEIAVSAQEFVDEREIRNGCHLEKEDAGLYHVLRKRKIIEDEAYKECQ